MPNTFDSIPRNATLNRFNPGNPDCKFGKTRSALPRASFISFTSFALGSKMVASNSPESPSLPN